MTNEDLKIMQRYLLGEMPETERAALEQEYFNDRQLFERMVQAENELVDKYARGLLPPPTRDRFEHYYLAHPRRRERAKFAEALAAKLDKTAEVAAAPTNQTESLLGRLLTSMRGPKLAWAFSVALLLTAVVAVWFVIEARRLRQELARTEAERMTQEQHERELQQRVADGRQRSEQMSAELDRLRVERQAVPPLPTLPAKAEPAFVSFTLTVGGIRSSEAGQPSVLVIPKRTERVRLQLNLSGGDYQSYRAAIQPAGGRVIYAWRRLTPITTNAGARLACIIPARRLAVGDYILTLSGVSKTGEVEDVSKLLFRVERK